MRRNICNDKRDDFLSVEDRPDDGDIGVDLVGLWLSTAIDIVAAFGFDERMVFSLSDINDNPLQILIGFFERLDVFKFLLWQQLSLDQGQGQMRS